MGRILQDRNQNTEALKAYRTALKLSPDLVLAQKDIDSILQAERP
jgi:cytochrome c-type biogenesis protein CcmH/NrfG